VTIEVLVFGVAAQSVKSDRVTVRVERGAPSVRDILAAIGEQHPLLRHAATHGRIAVNHAFAQHECTVSATDEVALISMVGGG
jgi:molybdopterin converting factor small subunit